LNEWIRPENAKGKFLIDKFPDPLILYIEKTLNVLVIIVYYPVS